MLTPIVIQWASVWRRVPANRELESFDQRLPFEMMGSSPQSTPSGKSSWRHLFRRVPALGTPLLLQITVQCFHLVYETRTHPLPGVIQIVTRSTERPHPRRCLLIDRLAVHCPRPRMRFGNQHEEHRLVGGVLRAPSEVTGAAQSAHEDKPKPRRRAEDPKC